ncbi:UxaA family hydrolase [Sporolituus thermophilus]|uniref:Altronate dehydratase large subunit n=1 Tax=Sporolituus thermophilus DSM 23256 TaxID=1123285 RepID=A0A1G7KHC6_9FIRM|nr:UxaA family hydrolase [Sporolituus thermophilus]SDF36545.1 altronate dehydratase large subunit [Sporolituus thermophilus DSM 23256]
MKFNGYRRPDGKVGIRNHVLVIPSVVCANRVARGIAQQVAGATWVEHQHGCTQLGADAELTFRVLVSHGTHPNVYGVVVVGLGCETIRAQDIAAAIKKQCPYKPVHLVIIQDEGGSVKATAAGVSAARAMISEASCLERELIDAAELILGTECGGSDACSGISGNPALGYASDLLINAGGTVVLAETTEIIGAEHIIASRAVNPQVAKKCYEVIKRCEDLAKKMGVDMRGGQPTPGNIEGGLSSIEEKSLGCIYKAGSKPLQEVIGYAEPITKKGLIWMDTPGQDIEQITGMVAGGCHLVVFTTGRGTCCGSPIAPTIKVSTNTQLFERMSDNIDLDAGTIILGSETVQEVGQRIFLEMLKVASGKLTKAEVLGFNDFAINRIGPTM